VVKRGGEDQEGVKRAGDDHVVVKRRIK